MNRFIIVDGLPYLYADGKAYAVRWDDKGFTVGAEVTLASAPTVTYSEISIKAKCAANLDSIGAIIEQETENEADESEQETEPEAEVDFRKMTLTELKEYAEANGIDLNGATKKADILALIIPIDAEQAV